MPEPKMPGVMPTNIGEKAKRKKEKPKSVNEYEKMLSLEFADIKPGDLKAGQFCFSVTPDRKIFITDKNHNFLAEKYGVDLDGTWTEGYLINKEGKDPEILFKLPYQPMKAFIGTDEEEENLKSAVKKIILRAIEN